MQQRQHISEQQDKAPFSHPNPGAQGLPYGARAGPPTAANTLRPRGPYNRCPLNGPPFGLSARLPHMISNGGMQEGRRLFPFLPFPCLLPPSLSCS